MKKIKLPTAKRVRRASVLGGDLIAVIGAGLAVSAVLGTLLGSSDVSSHSAAPQQETPASVTEPMVVTDEEGVPTSGRAERLRERLAREGKRVPSALVLDRAFAERDRLLTLETTVFFATPTGEPPAPWTVRVAEHPSWIVFDASGAKPRFLLSDAAIARFLESASVPGLPFARDAHATTTTVDKKSVTRATFDAIAADGYAFDVPVATSALIRALNNADPEIVLNVSWREGRVFLTENGTTRTLSRISTGLSDHANSPEARMWNVHKVFDERLQGIVIKQGDEFSFNATLGGPVTLENGWKEWLGLFGGGAAMTPGAGICQGATTMYRAALLAGLPFTQKRNHSLFVDHYEKYGIGLDATIFPGVHDLKFRNDTPGPIVLQTYLRGDDAIVQMYGIPDGRTVAMDGPYFPANVGTKLKSFGRAGLTAYDIAWIRTVRTADGSSAKDELLLSRYAKPLWSSLVKPYIGTDKAKQELLSTAPSPIL